MPILDMWDLQLNIDQVLRAQGANPDNIRLRRPDLMKINEKAISIGKYFLHPRVLYRKYPVVNFIHERLEIDTGNTKPGKHILSGMLISQHLAHAQEILVMICTIGGELEDHIASLFKIDPGLAIALDGVGSAAVEELAIQACNYFENQVKNDGMTTSLPLNPGMIGWSVEQGQPQIFSLVDCEEIQVTITDSWMMIPMKSLSMVLGIGENLTTNGTPCGYCSLKGICKYQNHYA
jgi:hypothetical protein